MSKALSIYVNNDGLRTYLQAIKKYPLLTEEQEKELIDNFYYKRDTNSAEILIKSHLRLVVKIAQSYRNYGLPAEDIISEGNIGLMVAVKKFNPLKKCRLSTYAMLWIKAYIHDYIIKSWSLVKFGTTQLQKKIFYNLNKIRNQINNYDNMISHDDIQNVAEDLNSNPNEIKEIISRIQGDVSLNGNVFNEDDNEYVDNIVDDTQNIEENYINKRTEDDIKSIIYDTMYMLNEREQYIIKNHLLCDNPLSLETISKKYNISRERVRQLEANALIKMKKYISETYNQKLVSIMSD